MRKGSGLLTTTALVSVLAALPGLGATRAQAEARAPFFEEIVVSASRREQTVQSIPSNITAVTSMTLERTGVSDITALTRLVPGLNMFDEGARASGNRNTFSMRGLNADSLNSNDDNPSLTQETVSTYLGETPIFFPFKLVDLERVEVLRGPQGTLYGAGAVGGTVRFIPKKPDPKAFSVDVTAESSLTKAAGKPGFDGYITVNAPLADRVAVRLSGGYEYKSGFIDAVGLIQQTGTSRSPGETILADPDDILGSPAALAPVDKNHNSAEVYFFRGGALFDVSDSTEINLHYTYQKVRAEGRNEHNPNFGSGENYVTYKAFKQPQDTDVHLLGGDVEVDLGFARLTSATAYSEVGVHSVSDPSGFLETHLGAYYLGFPRIHAPSLRDQKIKTFTQELRLVSENESAISWIVGGFFMKKDRRMDLTNPMSGISAYVNELLGLDPAINFTDMTALGIIDESFKDRALFGELTWHATERLDITGGVRVFKQSTKGLRGVRLPFASNLTSFFYYIDPLDETLLGDFRPFDTSSDKAIFRLNAAYQIDDDTLVYATWAQGYRGGGANALPEFDPFGNDNRPILTFKPDTVDNYEIGIKGTALDRLSYSVTAFQMDWKNFQTVLYTPFGVNYIANVPEARSRGVEAQLYGQVSDGLSVMLGYSYIDAETRTDFNLVAGDPTTLISAGTSLPGASKHNLNAAFDYYVPLGADSNLVLHGDLSHRSSTQSSFREVPRPSVNNYVKLDSVTVLNASVSWEQENLRLTLFVNNITNTLVATGGVPAAFLGPKDQSLGVIRPRTFGLRLNYSM